MFKKGQSGNPNGRPKGSGNNEKAILTHKINLLLNKNIDVIIKDFESLEPVERVRAFTALAQYVLPKMQAVDVSTQIQTEYQEMQMLLDKSPDSAISAIAGKMLVLKPNNNNEDGI